MNFGFVRQKARPVQGHPETNLNTLTMDGFKHKKIIFNGLMKTINLFYNIFRAKVMSG